MRLSHEQQRAEHGGRAARLDEPRVHEHASVRRHVDAVAQAERKRVRRRIARVRHADAGLDHRIVGAGEVQRGPPEHRRAERDLRAVHAHRPRMDRHAGKAPRDRFGLVGGRCAEHRRAAALERRRKHDVGAAPVRHLDAIDECRRARKRRAATRENVPAVRRFAQQDVRRRRVVGEHVHRDLARVGAPRALDRGDRARKPGQRIAPSDQPPSAARLLEPPRPVRRAHDRALVVHRDAGRAVGAQQLDVAARPHAHEFHAEPGVVLRQHGAVRGPRRARVDALVGTRQDLGQPAAGCHRDEQVRGRTVHHVGGENHRVVARFDRQARMPHASASGQRLPFEQQRVDAPVRGAPEDAARQRAVDAAADYAFEDDLTVRREPSLARVDVGCVHAGNRFAGQSDHLGVERAQRFGIGGGPRRGIREGGFGRRILRDGRGRIAARPARGEQQQG